MATSHPTRTLLQRILKLKADARLIDAAPALLAACYALIEAHAHHSDGGRAHAIALHAAYSAARDAVAQAVQS